MITLIYIYDNCNIYIGIDVTQIDVDNITDMKALSEEISLKGYIYIYTYIHIYI